MLLEGLIAILIFSLGILAIVGMQGAAVKASGDAKYRSDAALLANQLIGAMWVSDRAPATLKTSFETNGTGYNAWLADVGATLPGVAANPPQVVVDAMNPATLGQVTVTIFWQAPNESTAHNHSVIAQIR